MFDERYILHYTPSSKHWVEDTENKTTLTSFEEIVDELNVLNNVNRILNDESEHGVKFADKVWGTILTFNSKELNDIERNFLDELCYEMGIDLNE